MQKSSGRALLDILRYREEAERIVRAAFPSVDGVFAGVSHPTPAMMPAELGFLRMVSWLYVHYFEAGRKSVPFLVKKASGYDAGAGRDLETHLRLINSLRTYLQHNVNLRSDKDSSLLSECESWFCGICGTRIPVASEHWRKGLKKLCGEASAFFQRLVICLREMESDESCELLMQQWEEFRKRRHAPHEFDSIVSTAAKDMGRDALDPVAFRKKHYNTWTQALELLAWPYEFPIEARKLVEQSILDISVRVLPITGTEIMVELGVAPGPKVGEILARARALYEAAPCCAGELIQRLRGEFGEIPPPG